MEFSISTMFGGFPPAFFEAYHKVIPRQEGWKVRILMKCLIIVLANQNTLLKGPATTVSVVSLFKPLLAIR